VRGRREFTSKEAAASRSLLQEKTRSDRAAQKYLRERIRRIGFYISEFKASGGGFTAADFDELASRGLISITP